MARQSLREIYQQLRFPSLFRIGRWGFRYTLALTSAQTYLIDMPRCTMLLAANNSVAGNPVDPGGATDLLSSTAMPFAIKWTGPTGPTSTRRDTAIEALKYATELLGEGRPGVVIIDLAESGKAYAPADFAQFYLDQGKW
jgi:hypothetical protein